MDYGDSFGLLCMLTLAAAITSFVWFIVSSKKAAGRQQKPRFTFLILAGIFIVASGLSFFSCAGCLAPPHIPWPQVNVAYVGPKVSPSNDVAYFIKVVTQEHEGLAPHWGPGPLKPLQGWDHVAELEWSKTFLCRSKPDGSATETISGISSQQFSSGSYLPDNWDPGRENLAFDVSWNHNKAVRFLNHWHDNVQIVDLESLKTTTCTIGDPSARGFSPFWAFSFVMVNDSSLVLWSVYDGIDGVLDLDGTVKAINLREFKSPSDDACYFGSPLWNEEHQLFMVDANLPRTHTRDLWLLSTNLTLVARIDLQTIGSLHKQYQKTHKIDHEYSWAIEQYWHRNEGLKVKPRPASPPFPFQIHTIEHKRIHPEDAASIW
jgi:hypothetical protein